MKKVLFLILTLACVSVFSQGYVATPRWDYSGKWRGYDITPKEPSKPLTLPTVPTNPMDRVPREIRDWAERNPEIAIAIILGGAVIWKTITSK